jgi:hypothetical protein
MTNEVQLDGIGLTQMIRPVPPFDTSIAPTDGQALTWNAATSKYRPGGGVTTGLSVKDYGALGDGSTVDTTAISAAMDAANTAGAALFFPPGDYVCGSISKTYALRAFAVPGTVTIRATNTSSWTWNFAGSLGTPTLVTTNAVRGAYALVVASTTGLAVGDIVLVGDDQASYASQSTRKHGQTAAIASIDSGTTLTLQEPLYAGITTASNAFVAKVTAPDRARISGLRFLNANAASTGGFLRFTYCRDVVVDFDGEGSGGPGIRLEHVYDFRVRAVARNYYDNAGSSQFGYAVEVNGACAHGQVNVHALKVRHAFTCSGIDNAYGEPTDIRVTGVAHGCSAQSWDAHAQGSDIVFADCLSYGARSYGFSLRGRRQHVMGGIVQGGFGGVWLFESAFDNRISGLRISDIDSSGLDMSGAGGRGIRAQSSAIGLTITNCELVNIARDGIRIDLTGSDVSIMNNIFRNCGQQSGAGQSAIHFAGVVTRGRIVGNSISDNQGSVTTDAAVMLDATNVGLTLRDNDVGDHPHDVRGPGEPLDADRGDRVHCADRSRHRGIRRRARFRTAHPRGRHRPTRRTGHLFDHVRRGRHRCGNPHKPVVLPRRPVAQRAREDGRRHHDRMEPQRAQDARHLGRLHTRHRHAGLSRRHGRRDHGAHLAGGRRVQRRRWPDADTRRHVDNRADEPRLTRRDGGRPDRPGEPHLRLRVLTGESSCRRAPK